MNQVATRPVPIDEPCVRQLCDTLNSVFGLHFEFWDHDAIQQWTAVDDAADADDLLPAVIRAAKENRPVGLEIAEAQFALAVPIHFASRQLVTAARTANYNIETVCQVGKIVHDYVELANQARQLEVENESLVVQVTDDFQELNFLRSVGGDLEIDAHKWDLESLALKVLPLLRQSITAECAMLIETFPDDDGDSQSIDQIGEILCAAGRQILPPEEVSDLVRMLSCASSGRPLVRNRFSTSKDGRQFEGVSELIMVPVSKNDRLHGWLLVMNRKHESITRCDHDWRETAHWHMTRLEFGSAEASVVNTAATILASQTQTFELLKQKEQLLTDMVRALVNAVEAKDEYTRGHSERVALFACRLGQEIGLDDADCERLYLAGLLHDVGKIAVEDKTLNKPDHLTDEEYKVIQQHPDSGWDILHEVTNLQYVLPGVLHHHEKYDGTGYPDQLAGEDISLDGRILAVCDAYDAMTSDRPYRKGMPQEKAEKILRESSGSYWDPQLIDAFFRVMPSILDLRNSYQPRRHASRRTESDS